MTWYLKRWHRNFTETNKTENLKGTLSGIEDKVKSSISNIILDRIKRKKRSSIRRDELWNFIEFIKDKAHIFWMSSEALNMKRQFRGEQIKGMSI